MLYLLRLNITGENDRIYKYDKQTKDSHIKPFHKINVHVHLNYVLKTYGRIQEIVEGGPNVYFKQNLIQTCGKTKF